MAEGLQKIPAYRIPEKWDASWFSQFIREVLAFADTRNAIAGPGVTISGNPDEPATITAEADVLQLLEQNYVLATPSLFLPNERILDGQTGKVKILDLGPGNQIIVAIVENGIGAEQIRQSTGNSVVGRSDATDGNIVDIVALNEGDVLRLAGGILDFGGISAASIADFDEAAQDAVGSILDDSPEISFTYDDGTPSIVADLVVASVEYQKIQDATAFSVLGRAGDTNGVLADIVAANAGDVLQLVVAGGDPDYADVTLLMHFDGTNGSTTFTDQKGHTFTAGGNAQLDTAEKEFGTASLLLDGTGDYISTPDSADFDFGSGDFTIEFWANPASLASDGGVISKRPPLANGWAIEIRATGAVWLRANIGGIYSDTQVVTGTGVITAGTWYYVALVRSGTSWYIFVDGVVQGTATISGTLENSANALAMGRSAYSTDENPFNGNIDEMRITKGVARYTSGFSTPVAPFPDSGGSGGLVFGPAPVAIAAAMVTSLETLDDGAGAGAGTLTNAPTAGDPTKWIPIDDNGTTRYIPSWT